MSKAKTSIQANVLGKIKQGDVKPRPKSYFVALVIMGIFLGGLATVLSTYLFGLLFFALRIATANTPALGARRNLAAALSNFPWWLAIVVIILATSAYHLLKKYSRLYRQRAGLIIALFLAFSCLFGVILYTQMRSVTQPCTPEQQKRRW